MRDVIYVPLLLFLQNSYRLILPLYLIYVASRSIFITSTVFAKWSSLPHDEVALRKKDDDYVKVTNNAVRAIQIKALC